MAAITYSIYSLFYISLAATNHVIFAPSWAHLIYFIFGSIVFDLDHLLYYLLTTEPTQFSAIKKRMEYDYEFNIPHFYFAHTIEFIVVITFIAVIIQSAFFLWLSFGWMIHLLQDALVYWKIEKSASMDPKSDPRLWRVYFSVIRLLNSDIGLFTKEQTGFEKKID